MSTVRIGIIGLGIMGTGHAEYLAKGRIKGAQLAAVCDPRPERLQWAKEQFGEGVGLFSNTTDMYNSESIDAVIICTPHFDHPACAIEAFEHDVHVLIEKPSGVYTKQVRLMNEAASASGKVFGIMFNQRSNPLYKKVKDLIESGELGEIRRTNWIVTNWYRTQSYYDMGGWRATWAGEGGGVLINQCPHQLDLWYWVTGLMPKRMRAFCSFGKHRDIEVEDDVTAYVEYENGATGVFVTSVGDAPGTNRLEITGDRGKLVIEDNKIDFWRLRVPEPQFNKEYKVGFGRPEAWKCEIPVPEGDSGHYMITQNWVDAIAKGTPLLAPGEEGIHALTLSNAMHLSTWTDNWVSFPIDEDAYYDRLQEKIHHSARTKK
ncbi:MAG: oxidoreductase [Paenibacillus sp.]|nr:oxidoreductase [Paenibacillus sp.]